MPFLQLLYHRDLRRVGEVTPPEQLEAPVALGRQRPNFLNPRSERGRVAPLADPFISREQLTLAWDGARSAFEVTPSPAARRRLVAWTVDDGRRWGRHDVTGRVVLPPGSLLAIGDRVLLRLCWAPWRGHYADRMGLVGETEAAWALREEIASTVWFKRPVLLLGETGSGKELVARALHVQGPRRGGPFMVLNCAAIPEQLVESELFGHVQGAFTGAQQDQIGVFEAADGGTLFLDEFGDLPLKTQAKMLRVIQDGLVTPVGSRRSVSVDVRIIAATNRDPEAQIQEGRLRADLFYRIGGHVLRVPTLRARWADAPLLFMHFLDALRREHRCLEWLWSDPDEFEPSIPLDFFVTLMQHGWVGNVRELLNVTEQTARLNLAGPPGFREPVSLTRAPPGAASGQPAPPEAPRRDPLDVGRLNSACHALGVALRTVLKLLVPGDAEAILSGHLSEAERAEWLAERLAERLMETLSELEFNQRRAAEELGVSRNTLAKLMRDLDLPRPQDLDLKGLREAYAAAGGDLEVMARNLRMSPRTLKQHLTRHDLLDELGEPPR